jgi:hypothetical protein
MLLLRIVGLAVATGFCASASLALRRLLGLERGSAGLLVFLIFFTTLQSLLILAAGLTEPSRRLRGPGVGGGLGAAPAAPAAPVVQIRPPDRTSSRILLTWRAGIGSLLVKTLLLDLCGDAIQYHLPKIAESIQAGGSSGTQSRRPDPSRDSISSRRGGSSSCGTTS